MDATQIPHHTISRQAHDDREVWRAVAGFERLYEVSSHGRIRSLDHIVISKRPGGATQPTMRKGRVLSQASTAGYRHVSLYKHGAQFFGRVSHLVASAFIGPMPEGMFVLHGDGDRSHNHFRNLRYGTHQENVDDRTRHGTAYCGSRHDRTRLSEADVVVIRSMAGSISQTAIAAQYGLTQATVSKIILRQTWKSVA